MDGTKIGKLGGQRGKFFLDVEGEQIPLPLTLASDEKALEQLVGQEIEVFFGKPSVVAFRPNAPTLQEVLKHTIFTCYVPAEVGKISRTLTASDLQKWTQDALRVGALTNEQAARLTKTTGK